MKNTTRRSIPQPPSDSGQSEKLTGELLMKTIEQLYPYFEEWAKKVKGYHTCPTVYDIKIWHEFMGIVLAKKEGRCENSR